MADHENNHQLILFPLEGEKIDFWNKYPREQAQFDHWVRKGIYYHQEEPNNPPLDPDRHFQGLSRSEVSRLTYLRSEDPEGFDVRHAPKMVAAINEFLHERVLQEANLIEEKERIIKQNRLPTPPIGYYWGESGGGLMMMDRLPSYKLWNNALGYPMAEE